MEISKTGIVWIYFPLQMATERYTRYELGCYKATEWERCVADIMEK
ncbi:hypothetical protein [Haloimpatiens lingqiaonensis]|nr:hypothetical protein [Haloimpatiens lingqiaonensis]